MSDADTPPTPPVPPHPAPPPPQRSGCMTAFMLVTGLILLLPGICGLIFSSGGPSNPLATLGIAVGVGGIVLIIAAFAR